VGIEATIFELAAGVAVGAAGVTVFPHASVAITIIMNIQNKPVGILNFIAISFLDHEMTLPTEVILVSCSLKENSYKVMFGCSTKVLPVLNTLKKLIH
jgi:hypothetical protein